MTQSNENLFPLFISTQLQEKPSPQTLTVLNAEKRLIGSIKARELRDAGERKIYYQLYDREGKVQVSERSLEFLVSKHLRELAPRLQEIAQSHEIAERKATMEKSQQSRPYDRSNQRNR